MKNNNACSKEAFWFFKKGRILCAIEWTFITLVWVAIVAAAMVLVDGITKMVVSFFVILLTPSAVITFISVFFWVPTQSIFFWRYVKTPSKAIRNYCAFEIRRTRAFIERNKKEIGAFETEIAEIKQSTQRLTQKIENLCNAA
jgi:hypothetical protein